MLTNEEKPEDECSILSESDLTEDDGLLNT